MAGEEILGKDANRSSSNDKNMRLNGWVPAASVSPEAEQTPGRRAAVHGGWGQETLGVPRSASNLLFLSPHGDLPLVWPASPFPVAETRQGQEMAGDSFW